MQVHDLKQGQQASALTAVCAAVGERRLEDPEERHEAEAVHWID